MTSLLVSRLLCLFIYSDFFYSVTMNGHNEAVYRFNPIQLQTQSHWIHALSRQTEQMRTEFHNLFAVLDLHCTNRILATCILLIESESQFLRSLMHSGT